VGVAQHLDLDVPRPVNAALDEHPPVAEGGKRLADSALVGGRHVLRRTHDPQALAAAARARLDHHWKADRARDLRGMRWVANLGVIARDHADAGGSRKALGADLVAHGLDRIRRWADPGQPLAQDAACEGGVFGQEAEPWMHGVGARGARRGDDGVHRQVGRHRRRAVDAYGCVGRAHRERAGVGVMKDHDGALAQALHGPRDAYRDLAAVRDQHCLDLRHFRPPREPGRMARSLAGPRWNRCKPSRGPSLTAAGACRAWRRCGRGERRRPCPGARA